MDHETRADGTGGSASAKTEEILRGLRHMQTMPFRTYGIYHSLVSRETTDGVQHWNLARQHYGRIDDTVDKSCMRKLLVAEFADAGDGAEVGVRRFPSLTFTFG
jgi:hypothetical protein